MTGPAHILLIEDSKTQAVKLSILLDSQGWQVKHVLSAEQALLDLNQTIPDLILADYHLPGMAGDKFCYRVRMNIGTRNIPILMLTADETSESQLQGLESGADDYLSKTTEDDILLLRIQALLDKSNAQYDVLDPEGGKFQQAKILLIDDSETFRIALGNELESEGYSVEFAGDGKQGLEQVVSQLFDCVIVDLLMPGMDGIAVCRELVKLRHSMDSPSVVLMLTAKEGKEDMTKGLEAGADDFVGKSSDIAVIKARIRALLRRKFFQEENQRIFKQLKSKEMEAIKARAEKEAAEARTALLEQIEEKNKELERVNRELESFCYSVSHDLRGPLRTIDGFSQALLGELPADLSEQAKSYFDRIHAATVRMTQLIEDLFNLSRISRGELNKQSIDLSKISAEIIKNLELNEPGRGINVSIEEEMHVEGDGRLLRAAMENLLGNAWKFTSKNKKPTIEIGVNHKKNSPVYFVRDNGAGFDMAYADKLFTAFERLHSVDEYPGTGIGLATVQRIIHRHGGCIWADAAPGKGAVFYFTLTGTEDRRQKTED